MGTWRDATGDRHTSRAYFTYDLSRFEGKTIQEADFALWETEAEDCAASAPVELWRTGPVTDGTTWRTPPAQLHRVGTVTLGGGQDCSSPSHYFDIAAEIRAALADGRSEITFGLRIAGPAERRADLGRRFRSDLNLSVTANTPPAIPNELSVASFRTSGCGTADAPIFVGANPTFNANFADADGAHDQIDATFAWWPVDDESARQEVTRASQFVGSVRYQPPAENPLPEGRYGWAARSNDGYDTSAWSPTCYFHVDRRPPARPLVTSQDYPDDGKQHGGVGIPGKFRIDPNGSDDVILYRWGFSDPVVEVAAPEMGAGVELEVTPQHYGTNLLYVVSIDRTGNRSQEVRYEFHVRNTSPSVIVEMGGVDLPSRLTMAPGVDGVVEYRYRIGDSAEVSVPASADGTATAEILFTASGFTTVSVSSYTATGLAGTWTETVQVTDAPRLTSSTYDGVWFNATVGEPFVLDIAPGRPGVVRYEYRLNWDQPLESLSAEVDGGATLTWTPVDPYWMDLAIRSVLADGSTSEWAGGTVRVSDRRPYVSAGFYNPEWPAGGVGVEDVFWFQSDFDDLSEFVVQLNGGPEITTPAGGGNSGQLLLTPDRVGENVLTVRGRRADGTLTPAREWTFLVAG
ncbi:hypothetical protein [Plantactinospora sp. B5E13]|uniref:hypothetical protein n=1 Tax=Plantactinospora sp. B5E13 TaxID=3153758 RepID=UPI00325D03D5